MNDLVSIIVPVYNSEKYLRETVESFFHQTYENIEIVLVEGFSSDNSLELCNELQKTDKRIKILVHDQNYGPERARNDGIAAATGVWFMFVDSDDRLPKDAIETLVKTATRDKSDIVFAGFDEIWEDGRRETFLPGATKGVYDRHSFVGLFLDKLSIPILSCVGSKLYRTEMVRKFGSKVEQECHHNADLAFTMDAIGCCNSVSISDKSVYEYIRRDGSMMSAYRSGVFESISKARAKLKNLIKKEGYFEEKKSLYYEMKIGVMLESMINESTYGNNLHKAVELYLSDQDTADAIDYTFATQESLKMRVFLFLIKHRWIGLLNLFMKNRYSARKNIGGN